MDTLPDCMMPDGAEPCIGYCELRDEVERLRAELAVAGADLAVSVGHLSRLAQGYGCEDFTTAVDAALAAKEE